MRIAYITAGAGGMYCGSCLRDNALAAAMIDAGHDVLLIPTYTPTRTDERNRSLNRVFLGGINIYLQQHSRLFGRLPACLHRLLDYAPLLRLATQFGISVDPANLGALTVSMLQGTGGFQRREILRLVRFLAEECSADIVNLPNALLISLAPAIKAELKTPVCCTLQGEDLFLDGIREPHRSESLRLIREHAGQVDAFIAVSAFCADRMAGYLGIERSGIRVVPLGISLDGYAGGAAPQREPFTVGYLARIAPEKGLHVLCEAYRRMRTRRDLPASRLWAAGYLGADHKSYFEDIRKKLLAWDLSGHFSYHGELDRSGKLAFLRELSVFSVPGPYRDPKGLFLLEAMAAGVPVAQPRSGAFTEIVETTGGGVLTEPDNPEALAEALLDLWKDPDKRRELGARGYEGVRRHYSAGNMAEHTLAVYSECIRALGA